MHSTPQAVAATLRHHQQQAAADARGGATRELAAAAAAAAAGREAAERAQRALADAQAKVGRAESKRCRVLAETAPFSFL